MKRMKKLIAALMAVAMIASLNISAFATTYAGLGTGGTTTGDGSGAQIGTASGATGSTSSLYSGETDKAQGATTGNVITEGKMPEGTVHMVMPTIPTASPFNMLLDPNDLIGQTSGENARLQNITANTDYVYFTNVGDSVSYSSTSDALTVTNKGTWPLSVKLTAELSKGDTAEEGSLIQMVPKASLSQAAYKDIPAMYMAITPNVGTISGTTFTEGTAGTAAVVTDGYGIPSMAVSPVISTHNALSVLASSPVFAYKDDVLSRDKKILNNILDGRQLEIAASSPTAIALQLLDTVANSSTALPASTKFLTNGTVDANNGTVELSFSVVSASALALSTTSVNTKVVYEIKMKGGSYSAATAIATLTFVVDPVVMSSYANGNIPKSTITFTKSTAASSATTAAVAVPAKDGAYELKYDSTNGYQKAKTTEAAGSDYSWNAVSFKLSAAINKSTAWDDLADSTNPYKPNSTAISNLSTKVIWDVQNDYSADDSVKSAKVKVLQYAVNSGDIFRFRFDFGKGSAAAICIKSLTVGSTTVYPTTAAVSATANPNTSKFDVADPANGKLVTGGTAASFAAATDGAVSGSTTGFVYSFKTTAASTSTSQATLDYIKADGSEGHITFTYGASNA